MKKHTCYKCDDYQVIEHVSNSVIKAYQKPVKVFMVPAYRNLLVNGKRTWQRIGYFCPKCESFELVPSQMFEPKRHA